MTTPPTTLHDTLRAELDRRLAVARAATPGPWRYNPDKHWRLPMRPEFEEYVAAGPVDTPVCVAATGPTDEPQSMADAAHIALHDPADALRRYTGELEVLERHAPAAAHHGPAEGQPVCVACTNWDDNFYYTLAEDCKELRSLASRLGVNVDG